MAVYTLPDLPYAYDALEPHISAEIMELHHDKHHANYVAGANAALEALEEERNGEANPDKLRALSKNLAFNLGGHTNHTIFWQNMSPNGGGEPTGEIAEAINRDFNSFEAFQKQFEGVATSIHGSGWAVLGYDHIAGRLIIQQLTDQQGNISVDFTPLLMLDMWEHAFYLQYKNVKPDYVKAWWNVINWADAAERFATARG